MLDFLRIKNFKVHENTKIKFSPGLNVITGSSDVGKSTVFKAFLWLLTNRPSGTSFFRWGSDDPVSVTVGTDGVNLRHIKKGSQSSYQLIRSKTDKTTFKAIGTKVPEEVTSILNLNDYNLQSQFKPHFLLSDSPGEVARKLNELMGIDIIDSYLKAVNRIVRDSTSKETMLKDRKAELEEEVRNYKWVVKAKKQLVKIQERQKALAELESKYEHLGYCVENLDNYHKALAPIDKILKYKPAVDKLEARSEDIINITTRLVLLEKAKEQLESLIKRKKLLEKTYLDPSKIEKAEKNLQGLNLLSKTFSDISLVVDHLSKMLKKQKTVNEELEMLEAEKKELLDDLDICPVCGREM